MNSDSEDEPMFSYNPDNAASSVFNYEDQLRTSRLLRAILSSDVEFIKAQIQSGKDLHNPNNYGNTPLHAAVIQKSTEVLDLLLQLPDINLNFKNDMGDTPLLLSMKMRQTDNFIMHLLEAGCHVNIAGNTEETPLHLAITRYSTYIALELIKRDADINAVDGDKYTPLHSAVASNNIEMVCMLLYYNADVTITCFHNLTPFMYAVNDRKKLEIARVLFDYYVDFSCIAADGYNALLLAANSMSSIAVDIAKADVDVNWLTPEGDSVLFFALHYDNSELFKIVWPVFNHQQLLYSTAPFLLSFVSTSMCRYPTSEWVECMYEIINSPFIVDLVSHCINYVKPYWGLSLFKSLIYTMFKLNVKLSDRLAIIQSCLSFGAEVFVCDINLTHKLYGFKEDLELFVQFGTFTVIGHNYKDCFFPVPAFIFAQEENYSTEFIVSLFKNRMLQYHSIPETDNARHDIVKSLGFFSLPHNVKDMFCRSNHFTSGIKKAIIETFIAIPELPSLVELSRNFVRKCIKENCTIKISYQFHDAVNKLDIPPHIKNIILFKKPIYV